MPGSVSRPNLRNTPAFGKKAVMLLGFGAAIRRLSLTALTAVGVAIAALSAGPVGHDLTIFGDLGEHLGHLNVSELLRIAAALLTEHAIRIGRRTV